MTWLLSEVRPHRSCRTALFLRLLIITDARGAVGEAPWIQDDGNEVADTAAAFVVRYAPEMSVCTHLDSIAVRKLPETIAGCEECLKIGSPWVHLRMCMTCGKIGCCDSSPNRHASRHAAEVGHPIARSAQAGEDWSWCYVDEVGFVVAPGGTE